MGKENLFSLWKLILISFLYCHHALSAPADTNNSPKTDEDNLITRIKVCPTVEIIADSSYVKSCEAFKYPKEFVKGDPNLALCIIVYDTTSKICEYSSKQSPTSSGAEILPKSIQELDKDIKNFEQANNNTKICQNISSIFDKLQHSKIEGFKDLSPFIDYSKKTLLSNENCHYTCYKPDDKKINNLCTYLLWVHDLFATLKPIQVKNIEEENLPAKETQPNAEAVPKENKDEKPVSQISGKNVTPNNKISEKETQQNQPNQENQQNQPNQQNKQNQQNLPSSNQRSDDTPKDTINTSNNEPKTKTGDQKQANEINNGGSLPAPPKEDDTADIVESKKNEGDVDNPQHLIPDEINQDADSISAEEHQNKKENDDLDEMVDRENVDNLKESNNPGVEAPVKNSDDNEEFQQRQFVPHPQTSKVEEESHFFTYFSVISLLGIALYIGYHNKQKIFAILLEGRRSRRGRGSRRRPSTASYRKLDSNLEEAVTSQCNSNATHVIY